MLCVAGVALSGTGVAAAALPTITVGVATQSMDDVTTNFRGTTISTSCGSGKLISGGAFLRAVNPPGTAPNGTNGLVLGGTFPSANGVPYDPPVANGTLDPTFWGVVANFTGQRETGDERNAFALCATAEAPAHIQVVSATTTGGNAAENAAPNLTIAACPAGTRLVGGGAHSDPSVTPAGGGFATFAGNSKPAGGYPSDVAGVPAADGATNVTSWSAFGNGPNNNAATDKITALALCSTDATFNANHTIQIARRDVAGPDPGVPSAPIVTDPVTCPATTRLLGGGYRYDQGASGGEPGIGYHGRGSYPSDASGAPPVTGTTNPDTWSVAVQGGGAGGSNPPNVKAFALCAQDNTPVAPGAVSGTASAITDTGATLAGTVNPHGVATSYVFEYGSSLSFGQVTTPDDALAGTSDVPVTASLSGLSPSTTYYYRLVASSTAGTSMGAVRSFRTTGTAQAPSAITLPATATGDTTATVAGQVNPRGQTAAYTFEYGTSTSFGQISPVVLLDDADALEDVSATLTGLAPNTTYFYRVVASNATGTGAGVVRAFTTTGTAAAPTVTTGAATAVTSSGATLAGVVDPHGAPTTFTFEYGPTNSFGSITAVDQVESGGGAQSVTLPVSGLAPATQYRYRIVATNSVGTSVGTVGEFTTAPGA